MKEFFMKKICAPYTAALVAAVLLAAGCSNPVTEPGQASGAGTVQLRLAAETPRTLFPSVTRTNQIVYTITGNNQPIISNWDGRGTRDFQLGVGTWTIRVTGSIWGTDISDGLSETTVTVSSNGTVSPNGPLTIQMKPIENGQGTFSYDVNLSSTTEFTRTPTAATLTLTPLSDNGTVISPISLSSLTGPNTGTISLNSGYYDLTVRVNAGTDTAAKSEIVHIYNQQTTSMLPAWTFTDADFTPVFAQAYTQTGDWLNTLTNNLANMPSNTATTPYRVKLTDFIFDATVTTNAILSAFGGKYVSLELDNCSGIIATPSAPSSPLTLVSLTITGGSITAIGDNAFSGCTGLTALTLPASLTAIGDNAFSGCTGLTALTLPASSALTTIGTGAFSGNTALTTVDLSNAPAGFTAVGDNTFSGCTGLTALTLPASLTAIGDNAFSGCTGLTTITLPASVNAIGDSAFARNAGLAQVICNPVTPPALGGTGVFTGADPALVIKVPATAVTVYEADANWGTYTITALP